MMKSLGQDISKVMSLGQEIDRIYSLGQIVYEKPVAMSLTPTEENKEEK